MNYHQQLWNTHSAGAAGWAHCAAMDAFVAHSFGLTGAQYTQLFSQSSYKDALRQCLAVFTKKHEPDWTIPLNENLPQPVIDPPIPEPALDAPTAKSYKGLFDFQSTTTAGWGALFTEYPFINPWKMRRTK